jgi:uncharacterized protein YcbX
VVRWRSYEEAARQHGVRRALVLRQHASLLEHQLAMLHCQADELEGRVAQHAADQAAAKQAADDLLSRKLAASKEVEAAGKEEARLAKAAVAAQLQITRIRVQLRAAQASVKAASSRQLQKKLLLAEQEAVKHR